MNLTLEVLGRLASGYHEIDSIAQVIDLADDITVSQAPEGTVDVAVEGAGVPAGRANIVYRACAEFFNKTGVRGGAHCIIVKRIPAQAGLGGGSSNAAAALRALDQLYATELSQHQLIEIGAEVGSDVPLFLISGTLRLRGRGEQVEALPDAPTLHLVIVKPPVGVSTAWAYGELDRTWCGNRSVGACDRAEAAVRRGDAQALVDAIWNDFDPIIASGLPEVIDAKRILLGFGARKVLLCGSGSAVFGVFDSRPEAESAAQCIRQTGVQVFAASSLPRGFDSRRLGC